MIHRQVLLLVLGAMLVTACGHGSASSSHTGETATAGANPAQGIVLTPLIGRDILAPDKRYAMRIPADWIELPAHVAEIAYESSNPAKPYLLNVAREKLNGISRPQAYAEAARRRIQSTYQNVVSISLAPVQAGNREAYRWIYTARANGRDQLFYQVFIVDGSDGFVLTGSTPADADRSEVQATFDAIAGTLTFARG